MKGRSGSGHGELRQRPYGRFVPATHGGDWRPYRSRFEPATAAARAGEAAHESAAIPVKAPQRGTFQAAIALARPRQWTKNGLLIAAAGAAGALGQDDVPARVGAACVAFCLLASGIYALNDVRDAAEDRVHPRKRHRPVAAGDLSPRAALGLGVAELASGLLTCTSVAPLLGLVGLGYVALTISYTVVWRFVPILDLVAIAGGFVLRALAGGVAAPVGLSRWFVLVVSGAAVFLAAAKRHAELQRSRRSGARQRRVLAFYTPELLQAVLAASSGMALFAYCVWAFELPAVNGVPWRVLTIVPFTACLIRYSRLVRAGRGEAPEDLLYGDRVLLVCAVGWLLLFALGVNAAG